MKRLEIQLLGGFETRLGDTNIRGFESQKVRALFAYLALHRDQPTSRERLAGLLWPDRSEEAARRNLRQALHSIKTAFGEGPRPETVFRADRNNVELDPERPCWIDVEAFERAVENGLTEAGPNPHHLTEAARLYVGDLLSGFYVKDSPEFEEWMLAEQERLREEAVRAFHTLIEAYMARGEHRLGIQYARRLLAFDPLSEVANRHLIRLHWLAGQRNRALAQYERLRNLLQEELGVEPLSETTELYRQVLEAELPQQPEEREEDPSGPLIPLAGRGGAFETLAETWSGVLEGRGIWTVVEGEEGVGKTRLVKAFLDSVTSKRHAWVLAGSCYPETPRLALQPIRQVLVGAFTDLLPDHPAIADRIEPWMLGDLALVAPELAELGADLAGGPIEIEPGAPDRIAPAMERLLDLLLDAEGTRQTPVILLIDDLHLADEATLALLERLAGAMSERPFWVLAAGRTKPAEPNSRLAGLEERVALERLSVGRLTPEDVDEIVHSLVDLSSVSKLSPFLWRKSGGLPVKLMKRYIKMYSF